MTSDERAERDERIAAEVATWPLPTEDQLTRLRHLLNHGTEQPVQEAAEEPND